MNSSAPQSDSQQPDWFASIAHARHLELKGWVRVSALLWAAEMSGEWWAPQYESETEALAQPEIQLSPTTAAQYVAVYAAFKEQPVEELEKARPRLLYQAVKKVGNDPEKAAQALSDALVLSFSSYVAKWKPRKTPLRK